MTVPSNPAFHVGLALLLGMFGQILARHLRIPGIVVLLGLGVAAGADGLGLLRPESLGGGLSSLVAFAVAIILFEGGMALDLRGVRSQGRAIRRLVTVGAVVTAVGAGLAVHLLLGWEGPPVVLFSVLVVVTGPTVIQPLLRRIRVVPRVASILEGEAILGDAIGATLAVVALELALLSGADGWVLGGRGLLARFGWGTLLGVLTGLLIVALHRFPRAVPADLRNAASLAILVGFYQVGEALRSESGILVAIVAGLLVGNLPGLRPRSLITFKEELTVLLLGLLFVLLAADVRLADVRSLGWAGLGVVAVLILVVRPIDVLVSTWGTDLTTGEKRFLAWLAPRGIVAAAVASHFAEVFHSEGIAGGAQLRALVFLVIAVTVVVQGLSGGWVARRLGVSLGPRSGWAILGSNGLGLELASRLAPNGEVVLVDSAADRCQRARQLGLKVVEANALDESTLFHPDIEGRRRFVAATPNEEVNFIFGRRAHELLKADEVWIALRRHHATIRPPMLGEIGARILFGRESRLDLWSLRLERRLVDVEPWTPLRDDAKMPEGDAEDGSVPLLPLVLRRGDSVLPWDDASRARRGDRVDIAIFREQAERARADLEEAGWQPHPDDPPAEPD